LEPIRRRWRDISSNYSIKCTRFFGSWGRDKLDETQPILQPNTASQNRNG